MPLRATCFWPQSIRIYLLNTFSTRFPSIFSSWAYLTRLFQKKMLPVGFFRLYFRMINTHTRLAAWFEPLNIHLYGSRLKASGARWLRSSLAARPNVRNRPVRGLPECKFSILGLRKSIESYAMNWVLTTHLVQCLSLLGIRYPKKTKRKYITQEIEKERIETRYIQGPGQSRL